MANTRDLKSLGVKSLRVQVPSPGLNIMGKSENNRRRRNAL